MVGEVPLSQMLGQRLSAAYLSYHWDNILEVWLIE